MAGKREWLALVLDRAGVWELILRARSAVGSGVLTVVTYHRIQEPDAVGPFDPFVVDASPAQFDAQVTLLAKHFNLIDTTALARWLDGGKLPANPAMITFDDGYRECVDVALPILLRHRAPAVFFIATRYVAERRVYWWDWIHILVTESPRERLELGYPRPIAIDLDDRAAAAAALFSIVKTSYGLDLERFVAELTAASGVDIDAARERDLADQLVMTWDDVRTLAAAGMDVQSHTHNHQVLQTLSRADQIEELGRSREILEAELDAPVRAVAFPIGRPVIHDPQLRSAVSRAGYRLGFSNKTGVNPLWRGLDPFNFRRLSFDADSPPSYIRGVLALPPLRHPS
jgi:peptidoglycan/xylan/chitin deacetylase (PgdA/CDA1 family)